MKFLSFGALLPALLCFPPAVSAAYRCEKNGQIIYTDQRCDNERGEVEREIGTAPSVAAAPAVTDDQRNGRHDRKGRHVVDDRDRLQRERAEVARLQSLREQRERQDQQIRDLAARGAAARERKCSALALQRQWREEDLREAPLDKADKARTRLRRANEKYASECR